MLGASSRRWWILASVLATMLSSQSVAQQPTKKLIEYGWDVPEVTYLAEHLAEMQQQPFDGIGLRFDKSHRTFFGIEAWPAADLAPQIEALRGLQWGKLTDNFLVFNASSSMDWFNDAHWETILANMKLINGAVSAGGLAGIMFDPEPYALNPWAYKAATADHSFAEVQEQVRLRGRQTMAVLQEGLPRFKLFTLFALSMTMDFGRVPADVFPAKLQVQNYALLPSFIEGMLGSAAPSTQIIDGNEPAYYYRYPATFKEGRQRITDVLPGMFKPAAARKCGQQLRVGNAIWTDLVADLLAKPTFTHWMTPENRARMLEHNVYNALKYSDEYAWLYSQKTDWWRSPVPEYITEAVRRGREAAVSERALPFTMDDVVNQALKAMKQDEQAQRN